MSDTVFKGHDTYLDDWMVELINNKVMVTFTNIEEGQEFAMEFTPALLGSFIGALAATGLRVNA